MANEGAEKFLRAEEEAHRLVEQLSNLKRETESYNTARSTLQGAISGIARLTDSVAAAAQGLEDVVKTLRSIGTPGLLRAQEAATGELVNFRAEVGAREAQQREAIRELQLQLTRVRGAVLWVGALVFAGLAGLTVAFLLARGG